MTVENSPVRPAGGLGEDWPAWIREFESTLAVHSQYVFYGNVRDQYIVPGDPLDLNDFTGALWEVLQTNGYKCLINYDTVDGISFYPAQGDEGREARDAGIRALGGQVNYDALNDVTAAANSGKDAAQAARVRFSHSPYLHRVGDPQCGRPGRLRDRLRLQAGPQCG